MTSPKFHENFTLSYCADGFISSTEGSQLSTWNLSSAVCRPCIARAYNVLSLIQLTRISRRIRYAVIHMDYAAIHTHKCKRKTREAIADKVAADAWCVADVDELLMQWCLSALLLGLVASQSHASVKTYIHQGVYCPRNTAIKIKAMSILLHSLTEYSMIYSVQHKKAKYSVERLLSWKKNK